MAWRFVQLLAPANKLNVAPKHMATDVATVTSRRGEALVRRLAAEVVIDRQR
jgi:hypothetical protein